MTPFEIETLDNDAMNGRVAGLVSRYWYRQGLHGRGGDQRRAGVVEPVVWPATGLPRRSRLARCSLRELLPCLKRETLAQ